MRLLQLRDELAALARETKWGEASDAPPLKKKKTAHTKFLIAKQRLRLVILYVLHLLNHNTYSSKNAPWSDFNVANMRKRNRKKLGPENLREPYSYRAFLDLFRLGGGFRCPPP